ncbi:MAG TPA: flagellar biosynthetic protein FliO [Nitrospiria bacterium]|nr:flagellar biosynthetic protein FliO [Nitrospiria bacterium]
MTYLKVTLTSLVLLVFAANPIAASGIGENNPDFFSSIIKVFSVLFVILAIMLVLFYLSKGPLKNLKKKIGLRERDEVIKVIDISHIAPKKSICVVDVAGHIFVVGITTDNIIPIARLGDKGIIERPGL